MSPVRRRSARLATSTPKPSKRTMIPNLAALTEQEEAPPSPSPDCRRVKKHAEVLSSPMRAPHTPSNSSPAKPARSEMHPSKAPRAVAPPSSGFRLGFTDVDKTKSGVVQDTPTKTVVPSGDFTFRMSRPILESGLGPEAQRMMEQIREEAKKIKAELAAKREAADEEEEEPVNDFTRKFAKAKGKATRYSAVHLAEFKKMDSISSHPSAFRADPNRITPIKPQTLKRTKSKANLDDVESSAKPLATLKRTKSKANLDVDWSASKPVMTLSSAVSVKRPVKGSESTLREEPASPVKRFKKQMEDDVSANRPVSQDGSNIPRPTSRGNPSALARSHSTLSVHLMTPTKASLSRSTSVKTPGSMLKSPSKSHLPAFTKSTTATNLGTERKKGNDEAVKLAKPTLQVTSPTGKFARMKNLFRNKASPERATSVLPVPTLGAVSKTPSHTRVQKEFPEVPKTTPGRRLQKRAVFTPATRRAALSVESPSPIKSSLPKATGAPAKARIVGKAGYPNLDAMLMEMDETNTDAPLYPDIQPQNEETEREAKVHNMPPAVPGTFSFRSDHTINFGATSPNGFGASPGQSSLRQVRSSIMPMTDMPGSFPMSTSTGTSKSDKENDEPSRLMSGIPHGFQNKKRHRATWDEEEEEEREAASRAKKARRNVPEGDALLAPRLLGDKMRSKIASPSKKFLSAPTPSPIKKHNIISMSRLNMLARPKNRH